MQGLPHKEGRESADEKKIHKKLHWLVEKNAI
jgi:hypothetical protein